MGINIRNVSFEDERPTAQIPAVAPGASDSEDVGWDSSEDRDNAIATINGLRLAVIELQQKFNDLITKLGQ